MRKLSLFTLLILLSTIFSSCEEDLKFSDDVVVGKWLIKERSIVPLVQECEINEYIEFYPDHTIFRQQCGTMTGTWNIENEQLKIYLQIDTNYNSTDYVCELLSETELKAKLASNSLVWIKYTKVKQ